MNEPITFNKVIHSGHYTVFFLGTEKKHFPIYTESRVGEELQAILAHEQHTRPSTHDLISMIFQGLDIKPLHILFHDVQDGIYFARLFLEQSTADTKQILEIDSRPSDALTLAFMYNLPMFCTTELLEKAPHVDI